MDGGADAAAGTTDAGTGGTDAETGRDGGPPPLDAGAVAVDSGPRVPVDGGMCPAGMLALFGTLCMDETPVRHEVYVAALADLVDDPVECAWNTSFDERLVSAPGDWVRGVDYCDARAFCEARGAELCGHPSGGPTGYDTIGDRDLNAWTRMCAGEAGERRYAWGDVFDPACIEGEGCATPEGVRGVGTVWEWTDACASGADPMLVACHVRTGSSVIGSDPMATSECLFDDSFLLDSRLTRFLTVQAGLDLGFRCCAPLR